MFAAVNVGLMWTFPGGETIPFHFVWISIALVFGLNTWPLRAMMIVLAVVTATTGVILVHHALAGEIGLEETAEVPLMAAVFLVMVWHVRRRQAAVAELARVAELERSRAEGQRLFVRLVSHELRTPITVARGYVELIGKAHTSPQVDEDCTVVLAELSKLDVLTARIATLMQVGGELPLEAVDLDAFLDRLVHRWAPVAERNWRVDSDAGVLAANRDRLEAALDSLIENAVKFTADGDTIELRAWRQRGQVMLTVRDTGCGIAEADLPRVFDWFWSTAPPTAGASSGLGLAIAKVAVEARRGTITVTSTPGRGTTFSIVLPEQPYGWPTAEAGAEAAAPHRHTVGPTRR